MREHLKYARHCILVTGSQSQVLFCGAVPMTPPVTRTLNLPVAGSLMSVQASLVTLANGTVPMTRQV